MKFILGCKCGSTEFSYQNEGEFKCEECGLIYDERYVGEHLYGVCDVMEIFGGLRYE